MAPLVPPVTTPLILKLYVGALGSLVLNESVPASVPELPVAIWMVNVADPPTATLVGNEPTSEKPVGSTRLLTARAALPMLAIVNVSWGGLVPGLTEPKSIGVV